MRDMRNGRPLLRLARRGPPTSRTSGTLVGPGLLRRRAPRSPPSREGLRRAREEHIRAESEQVDRPIPRPEEGPLSECLGRRASGEALTLLARR